MDVKRFAVLLAAVVAGVAVVAMIVRDDEPVVPQRSRLADCSTGPWAEHCPEAKWARAVADAAGFQVTGDTGAAVTIQGHGVELHLWAFTPEEPELRAQQLREEAYERQARIAGVRVFGDGVRVTWESYGLHVWTANAGLGGLDAFAPGVAELVQASTEVPWP
ncbi:MAG TPA: hypothetical protein VHI71_07750 [Actinomycetota bacterium]|nr:hypothetical protein [Actinomycetota bacterium]